MRCFIRFLAHVKLISCLVLHGKNPKHDVENSFYFHRKRFNVLTFFAFYSVNAWLGSTLMALLGPFAYLRYYD